MYNYRKAAFIAFGVGFIGTLIVLCLLATLIVGFVSEVY